MQEAKKNGFDFLGDAQLVNGQCVRRAQKDGQWFHVNGDTLKPLYNNRFNFVGDFVETEKGVFRARVNQKVESRVEWFHISIDGASVYNERYNFVGDYYEGCARVQFFAYNSCKEELWCHILSNGEFAYGNLVFNAAHDFQNGRAKVLDGEEWIVVIVFNNDIPQLPSISHLSIAIAV
jgi:hypothetical protein